MTIFWHFLQDHRYFKERKRSDVLETRVKHLETEMKDLRDLLKKVLYELENHLGEDIDGNGQIGKPKPKPKPKPKTIKVRKTRDNRKVQRQVTKQKASARKKS